MTGELLILCYDHLNEEGPEKVRRSVECGVGRIFRPFSSGIECTLRGFVEDLGPCRF